MDAFTEAYVTCALWSSVDDNGQPLDAYDGELSPETLERMKVDCKAFQDAHWDDISSDPSQAGHDFWLTRNGHGAGFWDGDWPEDIGDRLTEACEAIGEYNLYIGDDGNIYGA